MATADPADEAMVARAHERFAGRAPARPSGGGDEPGALPNLIVIGGLKCGTTSLHHYLNLHPEIAMSRPKELNFFVEELNWELGDGLVRRPLRPPAPRSAARPRRTTPTGPASTGVAERMREPAPARARSSTWSATRSTACSPTTCTTSAAATRRARWRRRSPTPDSAYVQRSLYAFQLEPYLERFGAERIVIVSREELKRERARDDAPRCSSSAASTRTSPRRVRARVGDRQRQGRRAASA